MQNLSATKNLSTDIISSTMVSKYMPVRGNNVVLYLIVLAACINILGMGTTLGWAMSAIPKLLADDFPIKVTKGEAAWAASCVFIGSMLGTIAATLFISKFGCKRIILITIIPSVIGWLMIGFASTIWEVYIGRVLVGYLAGSAFLSTEMYISEISTSAIRGFLCGFCSIFVNLGFLLAFGIGPYLTFKQSAFLSLILPILFGFGFICAPESPYWYAGKDRFSDARRTLVQLRRTEDVNDELANIKYLVQKANPAKVDLNSWSTFKSIFAKRVNRWSLFIAFIMQLSQQLSGIQAVNAYAQLIFKDRDSLVSGETVGLLLGCVQLFCAVAAAGIVDRIGRRPMVLGSAVGSATCLAAMGLYFHVQSTGTDLEHIKLFPVIGILLYATFFGLGLSPISTIITVDCVPVEIRHLAILLVNFTYSLSGIMVTVLWQVVTDSIGVQYAFAIFAFATFANAIVIHFSIPETKGKTLAEVQSMLEKSKNLNGGCVPKEMEARRLQNDATLDPCITTKYPLAGYREWVALSFTLVLGPG
ncbi:facilitated trehalose transporter Tret1 isoform X2 [Cephus cinctus]|uniref:Facilitated trehalose transporter Tret1 isoform X2 n=1 Tax=Cephus cinctus TaxID=211228 RepID=A0AAJ7RI14_CEPCN|nr:facilitated trehalose transporter Tret1 isoform X2 [Cephus cinctus]